MKSRHVQPKRARAFRCRCIKCDARKLMERHPDTYEKGLRCESCGHRARHRGQGWRVDWYRTSKAEARKQGVCHCKAAPFPHRPGCGLTTRNLRDPELMSPWVKFNCGQVRQPMRAAA